MGKLEDDVKTIKEQVEDLQKIVNQVSFNLVRIMGTLEKGVSSSGENGESGGSLGGVSVDLGPIEDKIEKLEATMSTKDDFAQLKVLVEQLVSDRIKKAEDLQERANNLLEKGMEMIELEATLAEIKSLLEERILGDDA
ncbi:MAG: hypothetical protein GOP50_04905 [Candidatus Heimdallarchaeota archaeon]|nr:hypothetical protein [Candidatus Heimdallarchaeota archaeon]